MNKKGGITEKDEANKKKKAKKKTVNSCMWKKKTRPQTFRLQLDTSSSSPFLVYQPLLIFSTCGSSISSIPLHRLSSTLPLSPTLHSPNLSILCYPLHHYAFAFLLSLSHPLFLSPQSHPNILFFASSIHLLLLNPVSLLSLPLSINQ